MRHEAFTAAFRRGLADGTPPPGLTACRPEEVARRFAVYRNTVAHGLSRALAERFPTVERIVGEPFFAAAARLHIAEHPPTSPVLHDYGAEFAGFLDRFPPCASLPWLGDVARIDYARGAAFHAADALPLEPAALAEAAARDAGGLRFGLHPGVRIVTSRWAALRIWEANRPGMPPAPVSAAGPECALIGRRPDHAIVVRRLEPDDCATLLRLAAGEPLGAAAAGDPTRLLALLLQDGLITTIRTE